MAIHQHHRPPLPQPTAIVFDMDGTLLDSERIAFETFLRTCTRFEVTAEPALYRRCIGTRGEQTRQMLSAAFGPQLALEEFWAHWSGLYQLHAIDQPVPVKLGAVELLGLLSDRGIACAVATSTRHVQARHKLKNAGLLEHFQFVLGGDEVAMSKPHPQIYQVAAQRLGIAPASAWAIEDSDAGVRSAHAAGLQVIQVPDLHPPEDAVSALGHWIVGSLHDVGALLTH